MAKRWLILSLLGAIAFVALRGTAGCAEESGSGAAIGTTSQGGGGAGAGSLGGGGEGGSPAGGGGSGHTGGTGTGGDGGAGNAEACGSGGFDGGNPEENVVYVDPTNTEGGQDGSLAHPFSSFAGLTIEDHHTYRLRRGTIYSSASQVALTGRTSVVLGTYGDGAKPSFAYTGTSSAVRLDSSTDCVLTGWAIDGNGGAHSLVSVHSTDGTIVADCELHNAHNTNNAGFGVHGFDNTELQILYTEIHDVALDGIYVANATDIEIGCVSIHHINQRFAINPDQTYSSGDGIQLDGHYDGFHIHHTTVDRSDAATGNKYDVIFNSAPGSSDDATGILEHCHFWTNENVSSAVHIERGHGIVVRYNTFHGVTGGIRLGGAYTSDNLIHHNVFVDCATGVGVGYTYPAVGPATNTRVYNNVFYHVTGRHIWVDRSFVDTRNNIHVRAGDTGVALYDYGGGTWAIQTNAYDSEATAGTPGTGSSAVVGDPGFVEAASGDFHLQSGSPCVDVGSEVALTVDADGVSIPQGAGPDIGAYER